MRDRMERLVILPFSFGCASEANVAVGISHPRRSRPETKSPAKAIRHKGDKDISESLCGESMKNLLRFDENVPKSSTSPSFNRRFKGFKNFPLLFVDKEEMEIGCPTDVQHVTHIGWDGIAGTATATTTEPLSSLPSQRYHLSNSSFEPKPGKSSSSSSV